MIKTAVLRGLDPVLVDVEVGPNRLNPNQPIRIVGLGRTEVKESEQRLQSALSAAGFEWPESSISVNLAPADVPKCGTRMDLAIALAILQVSGQLQPGLGGPLFAIGELGFDGSIRPVEGALTIARSIPDGAALLAPKQNEQELALLRQIRDANKDFRPYMVETLQQAVKVIEGQSAPLARIRTDSLKPAYGTGVDFADVKGQQRAKRALEVAAAGGHNVLLIGPPGEGKSLLAKALPTILPQLSPFEIVELTGIYSAAGKLPSNDSIILERPFRAVHHTSSSQALVGGGRGIPKPGEITFAHRGVLFLDEVLEFGRALLETLRQPLEDGEISLQRTDGQAVYPCEMILVAAMNPCPCGLESDFVCNRCHRRLSVDQSECPDCGSSERQSRCTCSDYKKKEYKAHLSGPIMDRIDLKIHVGALSPEERFDTGRAERSRAIRTRVEAARERQAQRFRGKGFLVNARIHGGQVDGLCELHESARAALREVAKRIPELTTRGHDKLLKVSRTVADLNNSNLIYKKHIAEAAELCGHESVRQYLATDEDWNPCTACGESVRVSDRFCSRCGEPQRAEVPKFEGSMAGAL